ATVSVDKADMEILTPGEGIEAYPVYMNDEDIALISSTPYRPALPAVLPAGQDEMDLIGTDLLSPVYSEEDIIKPRQVIFNAPDGTPVHAQVFERDDGADSKPAVLDIHGGPMRQMLLGWSYS